MKLKEGVDCRFSLCNHITMHVLKAFTKKDLYVTWLLKRHIPLPQSYVESALDFCKENEGLNEQEAAELWQYLAQRNLLPNAWDKFASTFEDERLDFPIVMPSYNINPLNNPDNFETEHISFSVDPGNKEFEFTTTFASYEQDLNEKLLSPRKALQSEDAFSSEKENYSKDLDPDFGQKANEMEFTSEKQSFFDENKGDEDGMTFESVTMSHSVEDTRKKTMDTMESQAKAEKEATAVALAEAQAKLEAEKEANLRYEAEKAKAELEAKRIELEKQAELEAAAQKKAQLEAEKAKAELEAKRIELENQAKLEESAQKQAQFEAEKAKAELEAKKIEMEQKAKAEEAAVRQKQMEEELMAAKLENERKLKEMALIAEKQRAEELEQIKKQLMSDGSNLAGLKELTEMANAQKTEILSSLKENAQMMADAEKNANDRKFTFENQKQSLQAPNLIVSQVDDQSDLSELEPASPPQPEVEEVLDYEAVESFMKTNKLQNFLEKIIDEGIKHPNNLGDMSPPQRRKLADKLGMKASHRTRFMKACKAYEKSDAYLNYKAKKEEEKAARAGKAAGHKSRSNNNSSLQAQSVKFHQSPQASRSPSRSPRAGNDNNNNNNGRLSEKLLEVGRRVSASGQQIANALMKTFSSSNLERSGASPLQSSQLQLANGGRMPPPLQVHRMKNIPDDWIYIGGDYESNILRLLKDRMHNLIKVDSSIRVSLQKLDESTANTKNEVIMRFDEIINLLNQAKLNALKQCDEFSIQTRDQLIDICTKASIIQDKVSICYNESYSMLHISPADYQNQTDYSPVLMKFKTYTTQTLQSTMFDVSIPSILLTLHYGKARIEIPNIEVEANVDSPSQFRDLNLSSPRNQGGFNLYGNAGGNYQPSLSTPNLHARSVNLSNLNNMFNMHVLQSPNQRAISPGPQITNLSQQQTGAMDGFVLTDATSPPQQGYLSIHGGGAGGYSNNLYNNFESQKGNGLSLNEDNGYSNSSGGNDMQFSSQKMSSSRSQQGKVIRKSPRGKKTPKMEMEKQKVEVEQALTWEYKWVQDKSFQGISKSNCTFDGPNRVSCKGQGLFVADYEIWKDKNMGEVYWEIKIVTAPSLFWVGFIEGPLDDIEWEPGEYPPLDGYGIESEYGYWYIGTKYKGLGIGRVCRRGDTINFKMNIDAGICQGDVNNRDCRRTFIRGDLPECVMPAVLCYQGKGDFVIYGATDQRAEGKMGVYK